MKTLMRAGLVAALAVAGLAMVAPSPVAAAATYAVTVTNDELDANPGGNTADLSLREAMQLASADGQGSTITLQADATYSLTRCAPDGAAAEEDANVSGDLDVPLAADGDLVVEGQGATVRQTCVNERLVEDLDDHRLVLRHVTLTDTFDSSRDVFSGALGGGAVDVGHEDALVQLQQVTVVGVSALFGGALNSSGDVEIDDSTFSDNFGALGGGAIVGSSSGSLVIRRSTISHNRTVGFGAAVVGAAANVLHDSTVVANSVDSSLLGEDDDDTANLASGEWTVRGSIVAAGAGGSDCGPDLVVVSVTESLDSDGTCFPNDQHAGLHPQLAPLAANGGPTRTHRPVFESPVLDVAPEAQCTYAVDQRGVDRPVPQGGSCDLGSVEAPATPCATPTFPDVGPQHPFLVDICWLAQAGITTGRQDGTFDGGAAVTRQSMAAFLYRFAMSPPFEAPTQRTFPDIGGNHPFLQEIEWLAATEITGGYADGTYRGGAPVSRQAMAAFLARVARGDGAIPAPPATPSFTDVPTGHPFYAEIEYVASAAVAGGYEDGTYRGGAPVSRQAMSAFLHRLARVPNLAGI
jgi:hypothetical protein